ncbi:MAG: hypothetical protein ABFC84_03940 [Veillonellales bacterium]
MNNQLIRILTVILLLSSSFSLSGCANINPIDPQAPYSGTPTKDTPSGTQDYIVTYNYSDSGPVELSANNIVIKTGQKLVIQPASGFSGNTRFTSAGENFWGDIMQQQGGTAAAGTAIFVAIKPGKGKLSIIPNTNETDRAVDLWATVQ